MIWLVGYCQKIDKRPGQKKLSKIIAQAGISPNMISFMSMVFAGLSLASAIVKSPILAALFIQLRLVCNLVDGMVAVEFGKKSKTGDFWNDVPDRFADVAIILGGIFCVNSSLFN